MHINPHLVEQDMNTLLPLQPIKELEADGEIGSAAEHHYSYMGYILQPNVLLQKSVPAMIQQMIREGVDIVVLVPG